MIASNAYSERPSLTSIIKARRSELPWLLLCLRFQCAFYSALIVLSTQAHCAEDDRDARMAQDRAEPPDMIQALANKNPPPPLVKTRNGAVSLFPAGYDWDEQSRVKSAFAALARSPSEGLFHDLIKHVDDERYSLTVQYGGDPELTRNYTVGDLCRNMAYHRLATVLEKHLVRDVNGRPLRLTKGLWERLGNWRKDGRARPLAELQTDVCELALTNLATARGLSDAESKKVRLNLQSQIETLNKTKTPVFKRMPLEVYSTISSQTAELLRRKYGDTDR